MKPFGLYSNIQPALERPDMYLAVTTYAEEPEPYRDLLHFPNIEPILVPVLGRRLAKLNRSEVIPRFINLGLHEERYFFAYTLGRLSIAPSLRLLRGPVPPSFWRELLQGLTALHSQGFSYGLLREDTVAITDRGSPLLFDLTGLRAVEKQPPEVDLAAVRELEARCG